MTNNETVEKVRTHEKNGVLKVTKTAPHKIKSKISSAVEPRQK